MYPTLKVLLYILIITGNTSCLQNLLPTKDIFLMKTSAVLFPLLTLLASSPVFGQDQSISPMVPTTETQTGDTPASLPIAARNAPPSSTINTTPSVALIDDEVLALIREKIQTDLVVYMTKNQNIRHQDLQQEDITLLDAQWVEERVSERKPLISATLTNPLSAYLNTLQSHSKGLFVEIFVMDDKGLNVGQSAISTDYWQGDEDKWQKTYLVGPDAVFVDIMEFDEDQKYWFSQVNLAVYDPENGNAIGAATVDVNLTELERRRKAGAQLF